MNRFPLAGSTAAIALFAGSIAAADVTPEQVWQSWQELYASTGQQLTVESTARQGDTLVVEGVSFSTDQPEARIKGRIDRINLRDRGDGTVEITQSETYGANAESLDSTGQVTATTDFKIAAPGAVTIASGTPEAISYDLTAPKMTMTIKAVEPATAPVEGEGTEGTAEAGPGSTVTITAELTDTKGKYEVAAGENGARDVKSSFSLGKLGISGNGVDAGEEITFSGSIADLTGDGTVHLLDAAAMADLAEAVKAGFAFAGKFTHGATDFTFDVQEAEGPGQVVVAAAGGDLTLALDKDKLVYAGTSSGVKLSVTAATIPFPVEASYAEATTSLQLPVTATGTPGDFAFLARLTDLELAEPIWALIDPGKTLPRDPAVLVIDTTGQMTLKSDLFNESTAALEGGDEPDLNALDLKELRLSVAGAELTGAGAFTFDNSDKQTFGGVPAPTGKLALQLVGGNGLLDKLVALGLVPEEAAMQARMMTAMFSVPGDGADTLKSEVEFKDKGLFVNGQRLQ